MYWESWSIGKTTFSSIIDVCDTCHFLCYFFYMKSITWSTTSSSESSLKSCLTYCIVANLLFSAYFKTLIVFGSIELIYVYLQNYAAQTPVTVNVTVPLYTMIQYIPFSSTDCMGCTYFKKKFLAMLLLILKIKLN